MSEDKNFLDKITELESLFGQKEAAKRIGVSPSTLRNYKNGKTKIPLLKRTKVNRVYGRNKKKITPEVTEKYKKNVTKKKEGRAKQLSKRIKIVATKTWLNKQDIESFIKKGINEKAQQFIAVSNTGNNGQFLNAMEAMEQDVGLKKSTKKVLIHGLYITQYFSGGVWVNQDKVETEKGQQEKSHYIESIFPVFISKDKDLNESIDYLEEKFFGKTQQKGKRRLHPVTFLGFENI